jgi:protein-tyrosine phosphatase
MTTVCRTAPVSSGDVRLGEHAGDSEPPGSRVVFVCTANRARSPFAAALLRRHLGDLPIAIESFGTMEDGGGAPALPSAVRAAREFGIDLSKHRARSLRPGALVQSDLVIGFEPFHVASAVLGGALRSRTFLLADLAVALEDDAASTAPRDLSVDALVGLADARRGRSGRLPISIADPVGRSDRRFHEIYREIDGLVALVAMRLFGAGAERKG